ncbi:MAG: TolC family protein, partial [Alistipes sp.]|nr:TolC family protein [Alistipes sp.]
MRYIVSFIFIIACVGNISAQKIVSLKECLEIGLQNNYDLQIVRNKQQIADNNATMANAGMLPTLDLSAGYTGSADQTHITPRQGESYSTDAAYNQAMDVGVSLGWTI